MRPLLPIIARPLLAGLPLLLLLTTGDAASPSSRIMTASAIGGAKASELWWHHAVVYQVYPRSFKDADGDGIGDLKGITSKLEYLKDIGVTAVWLSPFYPSPQKDFGYDISDFKNVDPTYGTLADFDEMMAAAHDLGMKVVVDLVPNHSSDEHEWFQKSVKGDEKYKDYYVWSKPKTDAKGNVLYDEKGNPLPPNNWVSHFRFSAWTYVEERKEFYLHQFVSGQPDLNYNNPDVVEEMKDVFRFWMRRGVDGFRVDALPFLFETPDLTKDEPLNPHPPSGKTEDDWDFYTHPWTMDMDATYDMLHQWREVVDGFGDGKDRVIMTECYTTFNKTIEYYGTKDKPGAHFTFNFQLITSTSKASTAADFKAAIDQWMTAMGDWRGDGRWPNWVIGNHDNKRVATRYPDLGDAMNMISLTLPGTAMTYYGEELGMTDAYITWEQTKDPSGINAGKERYEETSRDPCRTPMQWDDTTSAGFSTNSVTWMPTNPLYYQVNVEKEKTEPKSPLNIYKDLTAARQTKTMKQGDLVTRVMDTDIFVITRTLTGEATFITVVNFGSWEKKLPTKEISNENLKVYSAAVNSRLSKGDPVPYILFLRPKEGLVLTTWSEPPSSSSVPRAAFFLSLLMPLVCIHL